MIDRAFWAGQRVLLTGHTGFKGSWLSLWLQRLGAELLGYALEPPTEPSLFERAAVARGMKSVTGDVRDREQLARTVAEFRPQVVFHLAAQPLVRRSYQQPVETFAANVMGTVNLLEAARATPGIKAVVIVTSDKCYESRDSLWGHREQDPLGGHDPYSASKACAELVTASYRSSFFSPQAQEPHGLALASARAGNVIGGGDWAPERLLPDVLRAFSSGSKLTVRNPRAVRPWQHVLEPLGGYLRLAERLTRDGHAFAGAWNFGPGEGDCRPVEEVIAATARLWQGEVAWAADGGRQPHESPSLRLDCSKAHQLLGWRPRLPLEAALRWVVEWHQGWRAGADVRQLSERQIAGYEELVP